MIVLIIDEPYFMTNSDWFHFDSERGKYVIEKDAPNSAKESYDEFYKEVEGQRHKNDM